MVSLYKREFLGIDKKCHEKSNISREKVNIINDNKNNELILFLVEGIFIYMEIVSFLIYLITYAE